MAGAGFLFDTIFPYRMGITDLFRKKLDAKEKLLIKYSTPFDVELEAKQDGTEFEAPIDNEITSMNRFDI